MRGRRSSVTLGSTLAVFALIGGSATAADSPNGARPAPDGASGAAVADHDAPNRGGDTSGSSVAAPGGDPTSSTDPRPVGSVNPLSIRNPFCDSRGLERTQRRNCRVTGSPEARYPTSNYGFDVHIDTGLDNISGNFASMLAQLANAIWTFCLFVLNIVLTVLGWAFSLSPFTDNAAMAEIDSGLERFYSAFTEPWLVVAMVALGAFALYRGIVRREVSATIGATVLSVALMLCALWVIHDPRQTIGTLTGYVNAAALSVLAAPQSGSVADPVGDYGEATDRVWSDMTLPGFSVLNFSDVDWALSEPDPELLETSNEVVCADAAYLAQIPPKRWAQLQALDDAGAEVDCEHLASVLPAPRTNAELYLRSSPGSMARERLWEEHADDAPYSSYLAIQGEGGAATRLPLVLLIALGLLGGILLLAWIAMRLFMQTAVAFVLVLISPLALFLPAFGERGRAGFAAWGGLLLGALVSKLIYAALLSVVLLATTVIGSLVDGAGGVGATMAFLAMAALWWAVFLSRATLLSFLAVSGESNEGHSRLGSALGYYSMQRVGQRLLGEGERPGGERRVAAVKDRLVGDRHDRREATGRVARGDLDARAQHRLDAKLAADESLLDDQRQRRGQLAGLGRQRAAQTKRARGHRRAAAATSDPEARVHHQQAARFAFERAGLAKSRQAELRGEIAEHSPREQRAGAFAAAARERERRSGQRWSPGELAEAREAVRAEADRPLAAPAHAWRAGITPERYGALRGAERERVHADVAEQLRADRAAFGAIPDRPAGTVAPRAARGYRREVLARPGGEQRLRSERQAVTRRRRATHRRARRGLSR